MTNSNAFPIQNDTPISASTYVPGTGTGTGSLEREETRIRAGISAFWEIGDALKNIRDGALYNEHGFMSFRAYCQTVWGFTDRHARYLIDGALIYEFIVAAGAAVLPTHETQTRHLKGLSASEAAQTWESAVDHKGGENAPTEKEVREMRARIQVEASQIGYLIHAMQAGTVVPPQALALVTALESCRPDVKAQMVAAQVLDATLIREMNRIAMSGSDTYRTIAQTGYLQFENGTGVSLGNAKAFDLRRMLDEARAQHVAVNSKQLFVGLYPDDPIASLRQIRSSFGETFVRQMLDAALHENESFNMQFQPRSG